MKKKILAGIFAGCLLVPGAIAFTGCNEEDKSIYVGSKAGIVKAFAEVENGGKIVLEKNIVIDDVLVANKKFTLDMNGKTLSNTEDIWNDTEELDDWSLISVSRNGNLTITGDGKFLAKENDCYAVDICDGGECTIESGKFLGNVSSVYVYEGELIIKGGELDIQQLDPVSGRNFTINCYDANFTAGTANVVITGGTFVNWNPAAATSESPVANFVHEDYTVNTEVHGEDTWYIVVEAPVAP